MMINRENVLEILMNTSYMNTRGAVIFATHIFFMYLDKCVYLDKILSLICIMYFAYLTREVSQ